MTLPSVIQSCWTTWEALHHHHLHNSLSPCLVTRGMRQLEFQMQTRRIYNLGVSARVMDTHIPCSLVYYHYHHYHQYYQCCAFSLAQRLTECCLLPWCAARIFVWENGGRAGRERDSGASIEWWRRRKFTRRNPCHNTICNCRCLQPCDHRMAEPIAGPGPQEAPGVQWLAIACGWELRCEGLWRVPSELGLFDFAETTENAIFGTCTCVVVVERRSLECCVCGDECVCHIRGALPYQRFRGISFWASPIQASGLCPCAHLLPRQSCGESE